MSEANMDYVAISNMIVYPCYPVNDEGTLAEIDIPFIFADGDAIPAYIELGPGSVRFLDCGEVYDHFASLGFFFNDEEDTGFLSAIAEANGVSFTDACEIQIDAAPQDAGKAFARYMTAMLAFVSWEKAWDAGVRGPMPERLAR